MLRTRVIPVLLFNKDRLVKTVSFKNEKYVGDPINTIRIFNEKEVDELILLDISATEENREPNFKLIASIASECFMPFAYGGGITNMDQIKKLFQLGVEKVCLNTSAIERPELISEASAKFGNQSIVVALDVNKNLWGNHEVYTKRGSKSIKKSPVEFAKQAEKLGAGELLINSVKRDGTWEGYDLDLIRSVASAVSIPVIACGGAGHIDHFAEGKKAGASALAAGSMFVYQKKNLGVLINFPERKTLDKLLSDANSTR